MGAIGLMAVVLVGLVLLVLPLGFGIYLIRSSRGRAGPEPRCGHCDYNLTGLKSNRCPECGLMFIEAGVIKGTRAKSRTRFGIGLALILMTPLFLGIATSTAYMARARATRQRAAFLQGVLTATQPSGPATTAPGEDEDSEPSAMPGE